MTAGKMFNGKPLARVDDWGFVAIVILCMAMMPLAMFAEGVKRSMSLVVMVDGLRADAIESGYMPNLEKLRTGKWQSGYKAAWSVTGQITPGSAPSSAPNHVSIATGFNPATHGVTSNTILENGTPSAMPTWLKRVIDAKQGATALFVYSWSPDGNIAPSEGIESMGDSDNENAAALASRLAAANAPDATLYFIDAVDHAGHAGQYYSYTDGYLAAVATVDGYIGACLNAIASRPTFADEDWLIAVTSDHGGYGTYHGQITAGGHAQTIPIVIAGTNITQGRIPGTPYNFDVAASALHHFGITVAGLQASLRDGAAETVRTLNDGLSVYLSFNESMTDNAVAGSSVTPEIVGSPTLVANGMHGNSMSVSTNNVLKLAGSESLSFEDSNRSFAAVVWAKFADKGDAGGDPVIFGNKSWSGNVKGMILTSRKKAGWTSPASGAGVGLNIGSGSGRMDIYPMPTEGASAWTFYAVTYSENGTYTLYQGRSDGTLYWVSGQFSAATLASGLPFYIGQDGTGNYSKHFVGEVDDFALWTRGLSHDDIRRIYECGRSGMDLGDLLKVDANDAPTMEVSVADGEYTLAFGGRRTMTHELYIAYGSDDAGGNKHAWESFDKIADIPVDTTTHSYTVPNELKAANAKFRFFLMQTDSLPYAKEVEYAHSDGNAWIDTGIAPRRDLVAEFDVRLTADNTEWGTGKNDTQIAIYENIFGAFCGTDKKGNYGMCRYRRSGNGNHNKWDRELNTGNNYQFVGSCVNDTDYHVVFSTTNLVINGTSYGSGITAANFIEGGYGIALYRNLKNGAIYDDTMIGYFKTFSLYTPKRKVRNYMPAVDAGGTVGMFDTVTGQFQTSADTALTAGSDCDAVRKGWVRCVSEKVYTASDTIPVTATYTGLGSDPLDFTDSANWVCENAYGIVVDGTVPTTDTAVTITGETAFAVPSGAATPVCASIRFNNATPTNATDWSGLDFAKVTANSVIDLKGHTLYLGDENSAALSQFTVTDSSDGEPGMLRISVASGATLANEGVSLTGNLKLKKEGDGTFSAAKSGQTYSGGTDVVAGTVRVGSSGIGHFGSGVVHVPTGTTYDAYGNADSSVNLVLAGGKIANNGVNATLPSTLSMTEDSTIEFAVLPANHDMTLPAGAVWNLGGKTLSVVMDGYDPDLHVGDVTISNGTFTVTVNTYNNETKGYVQIYKLRGRDGLNLDLGNTCLRLSSGGVATSQVCDFTANPPDQANVVYSYSTSRLQIFGTYTPQTVRGLNMTMMDGSTLDISHWSGAYNCVFTNPKYGNNANNTLCDLQFSAGTITVNLAGRTDLEEIATSESPYIVTWEKEPVTGVSFVLDPETAARTFEIAKESTGLRLKYSGGTIIIIL
ncbi:MAG: alkaline phosphatase family protein [Kiritimatiellae bacterium]|nr:alkaline phosphatase family protein [Kiritimatiellia bacterium]